MSPWKDFGDATHFHYSDTVGCVCLKSSVFATHAMPLENNKVFDQCSDQSGEGKTYKVMDNATCEALL